MFSKKSSSKRLRRCHSSRTKAVGELKRIAIIYLPDSTQHVQRVKALHASLRRHGFSVDLFDEDSCKAMTVNWIDVGELIVKNYRHVIFVASLRLVQLCRKSCQTEVKLQFNSDNTVVETHGWNEEHSTYIFPHALPVVVIDSLKSSFAWRRPHRPGVSIVQLTGTDEDCRRPHLDLRREHPSVFRRRALCITFKDNNRVARNKAFKHLVRRIQC